MEKIKCPECGSENCDYRIIIDHPIAGVFRDKSQYQCTECGSVFPEKKGETKWK